MEYLLKASAIITIFYFIYKVFLQRDTFFESNRGFLLLGLIASFIIPFLVIPIYIEHTPTLISNYSFGDTTIVEKIGEPFNILDYLPMIYLAGVLFFSIRFITQFVSLFTFIFKNKSEKQGVFTFVKINIDVSPFSFFNWIVYNPNQFNETEIDQIITHEKVHVKQYHSIDTLLTQLSCIVLWFNPFIWFYSKNVKQNLEFIADQKAQLKFSCKKSYQTTLLKISIPTHQLVLSNNFYNSLIKKRIVMLHKSKSKKINLIKYVFVIPLLAIFLMSFNTKKNYVKETLIQSNPSTNATLEQKQIDTFYILDAQTDKDFEDLKKHMATMGYTFDVSNLKRNEQGLITAIKINIKNKKANGSFSTSSFLPIKVIKIVLNRENNSINIGNLTNTEPKVTMGFPSQEKAKAYKKSKNLNNLIPNNELKKALIILNGNKVKQKDIQDLNADDIKYMNVLKGKKAIEKYGNKGKNGVVEITSKKHGDKRRISSKIVIAGYADTKPLYILDGKEISKKALDALDENKIEAINVIKNKSATEKYGDKGKNGVVEITTKKE